MIRWLRHHPYMLGAVLVLIAFAVKFALGVLALAALIVWVVRRRNRRGVPGPSKPHAQPVASPRPSWFNRPHGPAAALASSRPPSPVQHSSVMLPALGDVLTLTPGQFEEMTRDLLTALGFQSMTRCGGSGDLGVDLTGKDRQGRSIVAQCKRFAPGNQVGTPLLQSFIGMMTVHHHAERGVFVTTVGYSQPAVELARQHGISLIDGSSLLLLLGLTDVLNGSVQTPYARSFPGDLSMSQPIVAEAFIPGGSAVHLRAIGRARRSLLRRLRPVARGHVNAAERLTRRGPCSAQNRRNGVFDVSILALPFSRAPGSPDMSGDVHWEVSILALPFSRAPVRIMEGAPQRLPVSILALPFSRAPGGIVAFFVVVADVSILALPFSRAPAVDAGDRLIAVHEFQSSPCLSAGRRLQSAPHARRSKRISILALPFSRAPERGTSLNLLSWDPRGVPDALNVPERAQ